MTAEFAGKVAVVTGGAQGIGGGIAAWLAKHGAAVAIIGRDPQRGEKAVNGLKANGSKASFWRCDLRDTSAVSDTVERIWAADGRIDVLVNNAVDHGPRRALLDYPLEDWERVVTTNITGTFWLTREVVRRMVEAGIRGSIVNILAIQSQIPMATYGPYVASKGALEALTRAMAVEFAEHGIRANGVMVGAIYSGSTRGAQAQADPPGGETDYETVPRTLDEAAPNLVGRMGRPSDVAAVVGMLASSSSTYLTGSVIVVDGGRLLNRGEDVFSRAARKEESVG